MPLEINTKKIGCIGAGYVGGPTMAMLAHKCSDREVHIADISSERIAAWNSNNLPIYEPGLQEIVMGCRGRNLFFTTDVAKVVQECDLIFVSVNTPTKTRGVGSGRAANLAAWESAGRAVAQHANRTKVVIEKSTVPVRTAEALQRVLDGNRRDGIEFVILSSPEFLAEGTAIKDLDNPDRVLIGGPQTPDGHQAIGLLADIYATWVSRDRILQTNTWSSELSKLVANAFLAQRVSSINAVAQLCEKTGADVTEVARAIGMDSRIGAKFLQASVGFGGSCFQKDILNLVYLCEQFGLKEVADYWRKVVEINDAQKQSFTKKIIDRMFNTVQGKKIAIFGFAFKKDTGDTRETPALMVCDLLMEDGARLFVYDPCVERAQALREFAEHGMADKYDYGSQFIMASSAREACCDAHAVVILTEWDEFKTFDYTEFYRLMLKPAFCFDGRNILDHAKLRDIGFEVHGVGKGDPAIATQL